MRLGGSGSTFSYAQLEGLWIQAGGPRSLAPLAAAIAMAESGGNPNARNPSGATGLWQILGAVNPADQSQLTNPQVNAHEAVLKWKTAPGGGNNFTPWTTFTSGAYRPFLNTSTTPVMPSGKSPSGTGTSATVGNTGPGGASPTCIIGIPLPGLGVSVPFVGSAGVGGSEICLFTKTEARALIGGLMLTAGGTTMFVGLAVLVAGAFSGSKAGKAAGRATELAGAGIGLIPGMEGVGAGVIAAGHGQVSYSKHVQQRRQAKKKAGAAEDTAREKALGQPKENKNLEVGGGTIRESDLDRQRRKRRERERTKRSISPGGKPASREEAGF